MKFESLNSVVLLFLVPLQAAFFRSKEKKGTTLNEIVVHGESDGNDLAQPIHEAIYEKENLSKLAQLGILSSVPIAPKSEVITEQTVIIFERHGHVRKEKSADNPDLIIDTILFHVEAYHFNRNAARQISSSESSVVDETTKLRNEKYDSLVVTVPESIISKELSEEHDFGKLGENWTIDRLTYSFSASYKLGHYAEGSWRLERAKIPKWIDRWVHGVPKELAEIAYRSKSGVDKGGEGDTGILSSLVRVLNFGYGTTNDQVEEEDEDDEDEDEDQEDNEDETDDDQEDDEDQATDEKKGKKLPKRKGKAEKKPKDLTNTHVIDIDSEEDKKGSPVKKRKKVISKQIPLEEEDDDDDENDDEDPKGKQTAKKTKPRRKVPQKKKVPSKLPQRKAKAPLSSDAMQEAVGLISGTSHLDAEKLTTMFQESLVQVSQLYSERLTALDQNTSKSTSALTSQNNRSLITQLLSMIVLIVLIVLQHYFKF